MSNDRSVARVAVVTPVFAPYRAGMARVPEQDAAFLAEKGREVTVFTPRYANVGDDEIVRPYAVRRVRSVVSCGNAAVVPAFGVVPCSHEVTFLHYPFFGSAAWVALGRLLCRRARLVVVFHMDAVASGWRGAMFVVLRALLQWFVLMVADCVLVTSRDYAEYSSIARFVVRNPARIREVPLVVDTTRFSPEVDGSAVWRRYGIPADARVVMFLGALDEAHRFKGVAVLLDAFAKLPAKTWLLVCGGGALAKEYRGVAERLGVAARVVFVGFVSEEELPAHYRAADVFAFPSLSAAEAFGIAALEAMACGVPVVASALAGVRTLVVDGECGLLVSVGDVAALADALDRVLADDALRAKFGAVARARAVEHYSMNVRRDMLNEVVTAMVRG